MAMFGFLRAAELLVRFQQRLQQVLAAADAGQRVLLAEFLHRRDVVEQIGQRIRITGAGGRIGVVLDEVQVAVAQVRIEPRGHFERLVAGVDGGQHLLGGQQFEARQQGRVASTICSMRSMAPISASPVFTSESYCRREMKFGRRKGQIRRPPAESLALSMRSMQRFGPRKIAVGAAFQQLVVSGDCLVQLGHF